MREDDEHERKYEESKRTLQRLLFDFLGDLETTPKVYCPEDVHQWFVFVGRRAMDLLLRGQKKTLKQESIVKTLRGAKALKDVTVKTQKDARTQKEWVNLTEAEASDLARQFFDEHAMEL